MALLAMFTMHSSAGPSATVWTDGAGDQTWSSVANWNTGIVPGNTTAVQIGTQPTGDQIGIDTEAKTIVASFTFNSTLGNSVDITALGSGTLQVNGDIINNSAFTDSFSLLVFAGANAVWSGSLSFNAGANIGSNTITLGSGSSIAFEGLKFDINSASSYGRFQGDGTAIVNGDITFGGTYTGTLGDTFDFTAGNFSGATLGELPALSGGLSWKTDQFLTNGSVSVIPEPASVMLIALGGLIITGYRRMRKSYGHF